MVGIVSKDIQDRIRLVPARATLHARTGAEVAREARTPGMISRNNILPLRLHKLCLLVATFNSTGHREHLFDGAFPQFFGWLFQSGQVLGGELYKGGGARKL